MMDFDEEIITPLSLKTGQCRVLRHSGNGGRFILFSFEIETFGHVETSLEAIPGGLRRTLTS